MGFPIRRVCENNLENIVFQVIKHHQDIKKYMHNICAQTDITSNDTAVNSLISECSDVVSVALTSLTAADPVAGLCV